MVTHMCTEMRKVIIVLVCVLCVCVCERERSVTLEIKLRRFSEQANSGVLCSETTHVCTEIWEVIIVIVCA